MEVQCPLQTLFGARPCTSCRAGEDQQPCCGLAFARYLAYHCEDAAALAKDLRRLLGSTGLEEHSSGES